MKSAWITGANGLIGNYLVQSALKLGAQWKARAITRSQFDLLDFAAVEREFKKDRPRLVIHSAAVSTVADAAKNPSLAKRVNIEATKFLAQLAADAQFVFFSTDVIFDGQKGDYVESDLPRPLHLYGETKVAAEEWVRKHPRHLIVRTSLNGGISSSGNRGFNEQIWRALEAGQGMKLFTDEFRCPLFAGETARAVWELAAAENVGTFHLAGAQKLSRYQIGELLLQRRPELKGGIVPALASEAAGPPRALNTTLDISKIQKLLSRPLPGLAQWLAENPAIPF